MLSNKIQIKPVLSLLLRKLYLNDFLYLIENYIRTLLVDTKKIMAEKFINFAASLFLYSKNFFSFQANKSKNFTLFILLSRGTMTQTLTHTLTQTRWLRHNDSKMSQTYFRFQISPNFLIFRFKICSFPKSRENLLKSEEFQEIF